MDRKSLTICTIISTQDQQWSDGKSDTTTRRSAIKCAKNQTGRVLDSLFVCLLAWGLTALSAQISYIAPRVRDKAKSTHCDRGNAWWSNMAGLCMIRSATNELFIVSTDILKNLRADSTDLRMWTNFTGPAFKVTQGHWNWHGSIRYLWLPISDPR